MHTKAKYSVLIIYLCLLCILLSACSTTTSRVIVNAVDDDSYASITIYSYVDENVVFPLTFSLGHTYISIRNLDITEIVIGNYILQPNEEITISTWGQQQHFGIWYNLEVFYMDNERYRDVVSVQRALTPDEVTAISNYIKDHDKWSMFNNCARFSLNLWNITPGADNLKFGWLFATPNSIKKQIISFDTYKRSTYPTKSSEPCYYDGESLVYFSPMES